MRWQESIKNAQAVLLCTATLGFASAAAHADFSASSVYRNASPSVVVVFAWDAQGNGSSGTGSLVSSDGMILTNNHVIFDPKTRKAYVNIRVYFKPGRITGDPKVDLQEPYPIRVVARDEALDLALIQVQGLPSGIPVLPFGDSEGVDIGSSVAAIGHPGGGGLWTLTTGTISSRRREGQRDIFQTDAAINPGNSGGPLLDENARLIGVNTFVRRVNKEGLPLEGLNYSLQSRLVHGWLGQQGVRLALATPVNEPNPAAQPPAPPAPPQAEPEPTPPPVQPPPEPEPQVPQGSPGPEPQPEEPRAFKGPKGEEMYGVPQPDFSLMGASKAAYEKAFKNAQKAFDNLEAEFD
jgi:S1-C subfamily serine protease